MAALTPDAFVDLIEEESARFHAAVASSNLRSPVPSCPDWTGGDLAWHLGEVQHFWQFVVEQRPEPPAAYVEPQRPVDADLLDFVRDQARGLVAALRSAAPDERCWSWHDGGESVGWTMRRQAHEALIHRADAQLLAAHQVEAVDAAVAADGVDELVHVFLGDVPAWASFEREDRPPLALVAADTGDRWALEFGRFVGTSPNSGRSYDEPHARPVDVDGETAASVTGPAWALDLWLWGRGGGGALDYSGDPELPDRLRQVVTAVTQ